MVRGRGDLSHHANGSVSIHFKARGHLIADYNSAMGAYMGLKKKEKVLIVLGNLTRYHNLQPEQFRLGVRGKKNFFRRVGGIEPQASLPSLLAIDGFPRHHERMREQFISGQRKRGLAAAYMPNRT